MAYLQFETRNEFDVWHASVNAHYGFPNQEGTVRYTEPQVGTDGKFYAPFLSDLPDQFRGIIVDTYPDDE